MKHIDLAELFWRDRCVQEWFPKVRQDFCCDYNFHTDPNKNEIRTVNF